MSYSIQNIPVKTGMLTGMGVNMTTGQTTTQALTIPTAGTPFPNTASNSSCVQTAQSYAQTFQMIAGAEGSAWTEDGEYSLSASASYLSSANLTSQTLALTLYRSCTTFQHLPTAAQLEAVALPAAMGQKIVNTPADFLNEYGTHVIVGFIDGGSFLAGFTVTTVSAQDMTKVQTEFSGAINMFDVGQGELNSNLQAALNSVQSTYTCKTLSNCIGANPPVFSISNIGAMQDYLTNDFVTQLGTGVPLVAVCYPWEMLPCVANLAGYVPGSLSPAIDMGAVAILQQEYQQLAYGIQTAEAMQQNNCFVGPQSSTDLQNDLIVMSQAQGAIATLTFQQLQTITQASVGTYVVSPGCLNDLAAIANGRTTLLWYISLDGAFNPNSIGGTITGLSNSAVPTTDAVVQAVESSSHGDGTATMGYIYQFANTASGTQLQNQVRLEASFIFGTSNNTSASIDGAQWNKAVNANWPAYPWNAINVYFGSAPPATGNTSGGSPAEN